MTTPPRPNPMELEFNSISDVNRYYTSVHELLKSCTSYYVQVSPGVANQTYYLKEKSYNGTNESVLLKASSLEELSGKVSAMMKALGEVTLGACNSSGVFPKAEYFPKNVPTLNASKEGSPQ